MSISPGTRLGAYEVTALIGEGGMGKVYRATDTNLKRTVAIKVLPDAFASDPERIARFQREAETLARLNHPNIAQIHGLEKSDLTTAVVMELVEGPTLADRIAQGPIPIDEALVVARQIAEALEAAHEQGIIHRDLKPANIKTRDDGTVKVLDFGLAKALEPTRSEGQLPPISDSPTITSPALITGTGILLGTAAYMSPEQARGKTVDKRTDIWAFGCVLYEMLTGCAAFGRDTAADTIAEIVGRSPDWELIPSNAPRGIQELLRLCLEKDVKKRRRDAGDIQLDIEQALGVLERPSNRAAAQSAQGRREAWIVAAVALAAAAVTAVGLALRSAPGAREMRPQIITPETALPMHFALSPDGQDLVFVGGEGRPEQLWLRHLDVVDPQPLPGTDGAQFPFWSADSRSVGFFASGKLYRFDIKGGPPQILAEAPNPRGGTWNADGIILFAPMPSGPLMRTTASGGEPVTLTRLEPRQVGHRFPQFLPDGRHFLFFSLGSTETRGIYLGTLDGGEPKRLTANDTVGRYLAPDRVVYVRKGALLAQRLDLKHATLTGDAETLAAPVGVDPGSNLAGFSVSADGSVAYRSSAAAPRHLRWYDRTGKSLGIAAELDGNDLRDPELAPEDRRVAVDRVVEGNRDVWLMDLERGGKTRFTLDEALDAGPVWSPDGAQIAFHSARKGQSDLYVKPSMGPGPDELLLETPYDKWPYDWSKDGAFLLYREEDPKTGFDLKALAMTGTERKSIVVANTPFEERHGQFSPDGRWVAYATNESGLFEIVVQSFPRPTGKLPISTGGGSQPRWRADSKELYFIAPDGTIKASSISAVGSALEATTPVALFRMRSQGGGTANPAKHQYAVSRDGRFLINQPVEGIATFSPITLILNWKPK